MDQNENEIFKKFEKELFHATKLEQLKTQANRVKEQVNVEIHSDTSFSKIGFPVHCFRSIEPQRISHYPGFIQVFLSFCFAVFFFPNTAFVLFFFLGMDRTCIRS